MKLNVSKTVIEEVEVKVPFYYRHDLDGSTVFGKVGVDATITIHETRVKSYEIEIDQSHPNNHTCYLKPGYQSSRVEFELAAERARNFLNKRLGEAVEA